MTRAEDPVADMADLEARLRRANNELMTLRTKAAAAHNEHEYGRLIGKIEGVDLAISYIEEYRRGRI